MSVFRAERDAGLEEKIRATGRLAYASVARLAGPAGVAVPTPGRVRATNGGQPDLHYLRTRLVTVGWNKNDDVFDRLETWAARHTPEDKPFNYEHNCDDIIGHITGNCVVGDDGKAVAEDCVLDDLPARFHIDTDAVLYKSWEDPQLQDRMDKILGEIAKGQWFVSMEALFKGFDYALIKPDKTFSIVQRGESTAFLTKHLRAYGGDGLYEKNRVGRLLRNITFSGKGLVRQPANPDSVIFGESQAVARFFGPAAELGYGTPEPKETNTMAESIEDLKAKIDSQKDEIKTLKASLKQVDEAKVAALQGEVKARDEHVKTLTSAAEAAAQKVKAAEQEVALWKGKFEAAAKSAKDANAELEKQKADAARAARVAVLARALDLSVEKATEEAEKLAYLSDKDFNAHADYMSQKLAEYKKAAVTVPTDKADPAPSGPAHQSPKPQPKSTPAQAAPKGTPGKTAPCAADPAAAPGGRQNVEEPLDYVDPLPDAAMAVASADEGVERTRADVLAYMGDIFGIQGEQE